MTKIFLSGYTPSPVDRFGVERKDFAKVALNSQKTVAWEYIENPINLIKRLEKERFHIVAIEQAKNSVDYKKVKIKKPVLFLVGNEVEGIPQKFLNLADVVAEIPMKGDKESLNVSVAFGIALFRMLWEYKNMTENSHNNHSEISLSREWIFLSEKLWGDTFISELFEFLNNYKVKTLLECGCGGGHTLKGLAEKGVKCVGIDNDEEMINYAQNNNSHPLVEYIKMNWLDSRLINQTFDVVMCRGNSLSSVAGWNMTKDNFDKNKAEKLMIESLETMFKKVKNGGLLYMDTISQKEIEQSGGKLEINIDGISLRGKIEHDWKRRMRSIYGSGVIYGKKFSGGNTSYLMTPDELVFLIKKFCNPSEIWMPIFKNEIMYQPVCAKK